MERPEIYEICKKYFSMSAGETDAYLNQFSRIEDKLRLQYFLRNVQENCEPFIDKSDEKLKRKVGKVLLSKLDYSKFGDESPRQSYERIDTLLFQVINKGINPYKIIYCSVLTDANLRVDYEGSNRFYDSSRDFDNIYKQIQQTLKLSNEETNSLFEKCSTLIAKVSVDKITQVYNCLKNLKVRSEHYGIKIFEEEEVAEILKINPSLFTVSPEKIEAALVYITSKIENQLKDGCLKQLYTDPETNILANKRQMLRGWLKNNSSLLTINAETMRKKEHHLYDSVIPYYVHRSYKANVSSGLEDVFNDRINLALLDDVKQSKLWRNAANNLKLLETIASPIVLEEYIKKNPLVLGMKYEDLNELISMICANEKTKSENLDKFFEFGRTLFSSNIEFKPNEIFDKLITNQSMRMLDIEKLDEKEYVSKFVDIFMNGDQSLVFEIEDLIREKKVRTEKGEKLLRKRIRHTGSDLNDLPAFIKEPNLSLKKKSNIILAYASDVDYINESRFDLANKSDFEELRKAEIENNQKIENLLNKLRDVFEQKRFKVGKVYQNSDLLFEKMMDYLGKCFDDKEAISEVYTKEIAQKYKDVMTANFEHTDGKQIGIFGSDIVIKDVPQALVSPLTKLTKAVERAEKETEVKHIVFEKNK